MTVVPLSANLIHPAGYSKYPWDRWTNGQVWWATRWREYDCEHSSMRGFCYYHASRENNLAVAARIVYEFGGLLFQFYPRDATWRPNLRNVDMSKLIRAGVLSNPPLIAKVA